MEILGIGPMELFFIVVLAIIILGPKDMAKAGRTVGRFLRDLVQSDYYKAFMTSSREIKNLPNRLMREANLEDEIHELDKSLRGAASDPTTYSIRPPRKPEAPAEPPQEATGETPPQSSEGDSVQGDDAKA